MSILPSAGSSIDGPSGGNISDVVGMILDKGLVIDIYVRVSLIGIEILTIDARVVVASVDTYLRFAEAAGRLNLEATRRPGLPDIIQGVAGGLTSRGAPAAAPASLEPAQDATALPAAPSAAIEEHDGHDDKEPVPLSARRGKESAR